MAQYRLHCCGGSGNSYKLALYLNCAGLDWEPVGVDFAGGETRHADWRAATNTMGEVPVLEVAGERMSQSGAILLWLAETTGKFAFNADDRFEAMRWLAGSPPCPAGNPRTNSCRSEFRRPCDGLNSRALRTAG